MTAYYNENDPYAAAWLRNLIAAGLIAPGDVDDRSIEDVRPDDVRGYAQCHFFAGIGLWSYAARLAGIGDDQPLWTGSCPCQPFSAAGKGNGFADERHLWPAFFHLIRECRPDRVVGEQVASALTWYDLVSGDLEAEGYACAAVIAGAHSCSAPHIRQRLFWVADCPAGGWGKERPVVGRGVEGERAQRRATGLEQRGAFDGLDNAERARLEGLRGDGEDAPGRSLESRSAWAASVLVACADGRARPTLTRLQFVVDGDSARMDGGESDQEQIDGAIPKTRPPQALRTVPESASPKAIQRGAGEHERFRTPQILRPQMHGREHEADEDCEREERTTSVRQDASAGLRDVWGWISATRAPRGREPSKQRRPQPHDVVRALSHAYTLARMEGDEISAQAVLALRAACEDQRNVPIAPHTLEAIWRRVCNEDKGRAWLRAGYWRTCPASPLHTADGRDGLARTPILKASGNAIVPQLAAEFLKALP